MAMRSMVLRKAGYSVEEAYSAQDALDWIPTDAVDLVLICHTVPVGEQRKLIAFFRKHHRPIPILCLTADDWGTQGDCVAVENSPIPLLDAIESATAWP